MRTELAMNKEWAAHWSKVLELNEKLNRQKMAAGNTAAPTPLLLNHSHPPPRMAQAAAGMQQVLIAEQRHARHEAVVIAKETAYRQLIADTAIDLNGPQAQALLAEALKLCAEFNEVYSSGAAQKSTAAPAATLGMGAGTNLFTSAPPLPRPGTDHSSGNVRTEKRTPEKTARRSLEASAELCGHLPDD